MKYPSAFILFFFTCQLTACAPAPVQPSLQLVPDLDTTRFLGTWYEVGGIPTRDQAGCFGTTATYSLRSNGDINVLNKCYLDAQGSRSKQAEGRAFVPNPSEPSKLKVEFFWPFAGDYQVMALADDYSYAMIGNPQRSYLWILSRSPKLPEARYQELVELAVSQGYSASAIMRTPAVNQTQP